MRPLVTIGWLVVLSAVTLFGAGPGPALLGLKYTIEKESHLSIRGTTNVNSFECFSTQSFSEQTVRLSVDGMTNRVDFRDAKLRIRVDALDCDNSKMNADLCDALDAEDFPYIEIQMHEASLSTGSIGTTGSDIVVKASLTIAGQARKVYIKAKAVQIAENKFRFQAVHWIKMTDFGVDPPTALLGLIKVRDDIAIHFDLVARVTAEATL